MPDTTLAAQAKELGSMWKSLTDDEKEGWKAKAEEKDAEDALKEEAGDPSAAASPTNDGADEDEEEEEEEEDDDDE